MQRTNTTPDPEAGSVHVVVLILAAQVVQLLYIVSNFNMGSKACRCLWRRNFSTRIQTRSMVCW